MSAMFPAGEKLRKNEFIEFNPQENARDFFNRTGEFLPFQYLNPGLACNVIVPTLFENGERKNLILGFYREIGGSESLQLSIGGGALQKLGYDRPIGELLQLKMAAEVANNKGMIDAIFNRLSFDTHIHSNIKFDRRMNYATLIGVSPEISLSELQKLLFEAGECVRLAKQKAFLRATSFFQQPEEDSALQLKMVCIYAYDINEVRQKLSFLNRNFPGDTEGVHLPNGIITLTNYASIGNFGLQECRPFAITQLAATGLTEKLTDDYIAKIPQKKILAPNQGL